MRSIIVSAACLAIVVVASGCMGGSTKTVSATDNMFSPNTLSIKQNDVVKWTNNGQNQHTVTIHKAGDSSSTYKSDQNLDKGTSASFTFQETGTYHVFCKYHAPGAMTGNYNDGMVMTVTVT